jgi:hypothetical protein
MSGSISQLGAVGKQDIDTVIRPTLTFFKSVFKKHTNFAIEPKHAEFQGTIGWDRRQTCLIPRQGDLISKIYLYVKIANLDTGLGGARFVDDLGRAMLEEVSLEIGSVIYDRLYPEYMHAYEEVTTDRERQLGKLTGKSQSVPQLVAWAQNTQHLYVPLTFYFHDDIGSSLPLVGLHLTDVKVNVKTKAKAAVIVGNPAPYVVTSTDAEIQEMYLFMEIIFLDEPERVWMSSSELKYVITQTQYLGLHSILAGVRESKIDLTFNHPTKELIFMGRTDTNTAALNYFNFVGQETGEFLGELFKQLTLKLNNNNRFDAQYAHYFRVLQNKNHHTRIPDKHVYSYCFSLYPEDPNPSGSLNFSRIDTARFLMEFTAALGDGLSVFVYARNVNVVSIASGVSLLRFSS